MKHFDCFASNPYFFLLQQQKARTNLGGCFSVLFLGLLIFVFCVRFQQEILSQTPKIITFEEKELNQSSVILDSQIYLTFSNNTFIKNNQIQVFVGGVQMNNEEILVQNCSENLDIDHFFSQDEKLCLKILQSGTEELNDIRISLEVAQKIKFNVIFLSIKPNLDSFKIHKRSHLQIYLVELEPNQTKVVNFYFKKTEINAERNFFSGGRDQHAYFSLESSQEHVEFESSSEMSVDLWFSAIHRKDVISKTFGLTWFSFVSSFGGFLYFVVTILNGLSQPFLKTYYLLHILSDLIEFKIKIKPQDSTHDPKSSRNRNKDKDSVKSKHHIEIFESFRGAIKNSPNNNNKQEDIDKNLFDIKVVKSEIINPDEINISRLNPTSQEKRIRIFKFKFHGRSLFAFFYHKFFKKQGLEFKIIKAGIQKVEKILSSRSALEAIDDLQMLKRFSFNKSQLVLLNSFHASFVKIRENPSKLIDGTIFSYKKFGFRDVNRILLKAYKRTANQNFRSKKDEKILRLIDEEARKLLDKLIRE